MNHIVNLCPMTKLEAACSLCTILATVQSTGWRTWRLQRLQNEVNDTDDILKVVESKVKVMDNIFRKCSFHGGGILIDGSPSETIELSVVFFYMTLWSVYRVKCLKRFVRVMICLFVQNCALQYSALLEKVETPRYVMYAVAVNIAFIVSFWSCSLRGDYLPGKPGKSPEDNVRERLKFLFIIKC